MFEETGERDILDDYPVLGKPPAFRYRGNCYKIPEAHAALYPPRVEEDYKKWEFSSMLGMIKWCSPCPVLEECGQWAIDHKESGPYAGRWFNDGVMAAVPHSLKTSIPGGMDMFSDVPVANNNARANRKENYDIYASGEGGRSYRKSKSLLPSTAVAEEGDPR